MTQGQKAACALIVSASLCLLAGAASAQEAGRAARSALLNALDSAAQATSPAFSGFSSARGEALYWGPHAGGKPEMNACAACHTANPARPGRHVLTGRDIEPMAVSANPQRFTNPDQVAKRFARDCPNVLGRACTAIEQGDFITFLSNQ